MDSTVSSPSSDVIRCMLPLLSCVCTFVCFRRIYFGDSPSDQDETCTTLCCVSRGLVYTYLLFSVFFCPARTHGRHTGRVKHRGFFHLFLCIFCPTVLLRYLPLFFYREKGSAVPIQVYQLFFSHPRNLNLPCV